VKDLNLRPSG